jgi:hypothetical protein
VTQWLLQLERQRYSRENAVSVATLQREFQQLVWPKEDTP